MNRTARYLAAAAAVTVVAAGVLAAASALSARQDDRTFVCVSYGTGSPVEMELRPDDPVPAGCEPLAAAAAEQRRSEWWLLAGWTILATGFGLIAFLARQERRAAGPPGDRSGRAVIGWRPTLFVVTVAAVGCASFAFSERQDGHLYTCRSPDADGVVRDYQLTVGQPLRTDACVEERELALARQEAPRLIYRGAAALAIAGAAAPLVLAAYRRRRPPTP